MLQNEKQNMRKLPEHDSKPSEGQSLNQKGSCAEMGEAVGFKSQYKTGHQVVFHLPAG